MTANIRSITKRRAAIAALGVATSVLTLASCGSPATVRDAGAAAALPNHTYVESVQSVKFDKDYALMTTAMTDGHPVKGTMFKHASYGVKALNAEWDVEMLGDPASVFVRTRVLKTNAGDNLDLYHQGGSPVDNFLLGSQYASIAKSPWARVTTNYGNPLNVCLVTGYQTVCDMEDAVTQTLKEGSNVTKRVTDNGDGTTTLLTGVTLASMLKYNFLLNVPSSISDKFTPAMLKYQLPARFVIDSKGAIQIASIQGVVPGSTPFVVQVGFQVTGFAQQSDFPTLPPANQITNVPHKTFNDALDKINGA